MAAPVVVPVVVIGSGVAGLSAALALAPLPVVLVTKTGALASGSTPWAQGGIAAALGAGDSPEMHLADTIAAGAGLTDPVVTSLLTRQGAAAVRDLIDRGLPFDRDGTGAPLLGREAAHSVDRIIHAQGDRTGRVVADWLAAAAQQASHITVLTDTLATDLVEADGRIAGVQVHGPQGWQVLPARAVVLASGGWGMVWRDTTNPAENTGDGLVMAARAGAMLADLEFMQFHPTALAVSDGSGARLPLLTEALRGAGAVLLDAAGRAFMAAEHPLADLAPRDVVARAVGQRIAAGEVVRLDLRPALKAKGVAGFPQVMEVCAAAGLDPLTDPVPITPAAHYAMGGVVTDPRGRTSRSGLWACGEVACTGVHGANRLASNSLLEGLVFARQVAADIRATLSRPQAVTDTDLYAPVPVLTRPDAAAVQAVRDAMSRQVGLVRDADGLTATAAAIAAVTVQPLPEHANAGEIRQAVEARNLLTIAGLVTDAALRRRESRGAHWRRDYPEANPALARRLTQRLEEDGQSTTVSAALSVVAT